MYKIFILAFLFRKLAKSKKNSGKKDKQTAKKKKNVSADSNASNFNNTNLAEDEIESNLENEVDINIYQEYFRELDIDTWLILTQKFVINPDPEKVSSIN